jgi:hypothetical protein
VPAPALDLHKVEPLHWLSERSTTYQETIVTTLVITVATMLRRSLVSICGFASLSSCALSGWNIANGRIEILGNSFGVPGVEVSYDYIVSDANALLACPGLRRHVFRLLVPALLEERLRLVLRSLAFPLDSSSLARSTSLTMEIAQPSLAMTRLPTRTMLLTPLSSMT